MESNYFPLFSTVFTVLTDSTHKAGFRDQVMLLFLMLREAASSKVISILSLRWKE